MIVSAMVLDKMDGKEIAPGVFLIGEPRPVPNTNQLQSLANVRGMLCLIQLKMIFKDEEKELP